MKKVFYILSGAFTALALIAALVFNGWVAFDLASIGYTCLALIFAAFFLVITFAPKGGSRSDVGGLKYSKKDGDGEFVYVKDKNKRPANERERTLGSIVLFVGSLFVPFIFFFDSFRGWLFIVVIVIILIAVMVLPIVMIFKHLLELRKQLDEEAKREAQLRKEQDEREALGKWK